MFLVSLVSGTPGKIKGKLKRTKEKKKSNKEDVVREEVSCLL